MSKSSPNLPSEFDILVVGAGAAGLYASLCLPEHLRVCLITKDTLKVGASDWAQGGIAAAIDPTDSPQLHQEDTIRAGCGLCEPEAVKFLVENAPAAIQSLLEIGVEFDSHTEKLAMTLEAAHSRPRVLHAADTTGRAIVSVLTARVLERPNIQVLSQAFASNLWLNRSTGHCQGISLLYQGQISWIAARAVILATGGGGQVFAQTTNPTVSTGDGVAIAFRAGALLRDLEFVQFHPTALSKPGAPRFLISEAVRGEGAHLVDEKGHRFAFDYHPAGELAPRDVVSRAIFNHLQKTPSSECCVYLDLRPIPAKRISYRFPNIIQVCQQWGIDVFQDPIPVTPAAHYWMGGIVADTANRTSIPGLYAIGETASTGVHGANRLASNSLLECLVYAAQLSQIEPLGSPLAPPDLRGVAEGAVRRENHREQGEQEGANLDPEIEQILAVRQQLPTLMWQSAGICRSLGVLEQAIARVSSWRSQLAEFAISPYITKVCHKDNSTINHNYSHEELRICAETLNLVDVAYLILRSAAFRTESRGGHYRTDYPETDPHWLCHTVVVNNELHKLPWG